MAVITLPDGLLIQRLTIGQRRFDLGMENPDTGDTSVRLLGPPRWTLAFTSDQQMEPLQARTWESMLLRLRGRVNLLEAWDHGKRAPLGSMRGTMILSGAVAAGATTLTISTNSAQAGKTLFAGDWLRIGSGLGTSQLVKAVVDTTADINGSVVVQIEPPLRTAFSTSTPVAWDKPTTYFRMNQADNAWVYERAVQGGFAFDGLEVWR
jgi:hypothetical protein